MGASFLTSACRETLASRITSLSYKHSTRQPKTAPVNSLSAGPLFSASCNLALPKASVVQTSCTRFSFSARPLANASVKNDERVEIVGHSSRFGERNFHLQETNQT